MYAMTTSRSFAVLLFLALRVLSATTLPPCYPERSNLVSYIQGSYAGFQGANYVISNGMWVLVEPCDENVRKLCYPIARRDSANYIAGSQASANATAYMLDAFGSWMAVADCQYRPLSVGNATRFAPGWAEDPADAFCTDMGTSTTTLGEITPPTTTSEVFPTTTATALPVNFTPLPPLYAGVNSFFIYSLTTDTQKAILSALQSAGVKALRIFITSVGAGSKGTDSVGSSDLEASTVGQYNDGILSQIDALMALVVQYGIRLQITMHDRWNLDSTWGTCDAYCQTFCNGGSNVNAFYNDADAQAAFDARLAHIVTHVNPLMGNRMWKDIPEAIYSFEIGNEEQGGGHFTNPDWWCGRATALKQVIGDSYVLIGTGGGQDFQMSIIENNFACEAIDSVSIHSYDGNVDNIKSALQSAAQMGQQYNKRVVFQEFGRQYDKGAWISTVAGIANQLGVSWMPWEVSKPGMSNDYEFWTDDTGAFDALAQYAGQIA